MARKIQTGIEIKAGVTGTEAIRRLADSIDATSVDTAQLRQEGNALAQTWQELGTKQALIARFRELKTESVALGAQLADARRRTAELAAAMRNNPSAKLKKEFEAAKKAAADLKAKHTELQQKLQQTRNAMTEAGLSTRNLAAQERQLAADVAAAKAKLAELNAEAQRLKKLAEARAVLGVDVDTRVRQELQQLTAAYNTLRNNGNLSKKELARLTEQYRRRVRELNEELRGTSTRLNPIAGSLRGLGAAGLAIAGVGGGLYAVKEGLQAIINKTREFQAIRTRLDYAFGSAEEGGKQLDFVRDVAERLGLELKGAATGYAKLAAATKNLNISNAETQQIFTGVASAVAAMGLSADEANGVFLALSQIAGKGKVSMEELRGQLGERLSPAMAIAAKAMGVTTAELGHMVEAGLSAEAFLPKFGAALEQAFGAHAAKNADSLTGKINALKNQFDEMLNGFGEGGVAAGAIAVMDDLSQAMSWLETQINSMDATISGGMRDALVSLYELIKEVAGVIGGQLASNLDVINSVGVAISGLSAEGEQDFNVIKGAIDGINIALGVLRDTIAAIGIAANLANGITLKGFAKLADRLSMLTTMMPEVSANFARMAEQIEADAQRHFAAAHEAAMNFESKAAAAFRRASETEAERYRRLEQEARTSYQQATQAAIDASDAAMAAQERAAAAIGTAAEEASAKQAQEANKAAGQAAAAAQKAEDAWRQAFAAIGGSAEEAAQITQPLRDAGLAAIDTAGEIEEVSRALANAKGAALGLGLDLRAAMADPTPAMLAMLEHQEKIRAGFADLSAAGIDAGKLVREAMAKMLASASSEADIGAIKQAFRELGRDGRLSMRELEQGILDADVRLQELHGAIDPVTAAFKKLGIQTQKALRLSAKQMRLAFETAEASGQASADNLQAAFKRAADAALASGDAQAQAWVRAKAAQYGYMLQIEATGKAMLRQAGEAAQAADKEERAQQQAAAALRRRAQAEAEAADKADQNAEAVERQAGAVTRAAQAVVHEGRRINNMDLGRLDQEIDDARRRMQGLADDAKKTRQSLESELAGVRGETDKVERLAYEQKMAELRQKLAEAERDDNTAAVDEYRRALALQQQIYNTKTAQRKEADKAAAAEALQKSLDEQNAALKQQAAPEIRIESEPAAVHIDDEMVRQLTGSLQDALSERERALVDKVIRAVVDRLQNEFKRMGR